MFSSLSKKSLFKSALFKNTPVYVQFYVTSRCNLTCKQCNIIYANSDVREVTLDEVKKIANNFSKLGVAIVLLTGGEPFLREDLPEIIKAFEDHGIHVRMQTNGLASEEQIHKAIEYGGKDISISLDSLNPQIQDYINGEFKGSWERAIKAISVFTKYLPIESSFASLGCVFQRNNINDIIDIIKFGTSIDWFTSLVPIHVTDMFNPMGFRTFDQGLKFKEDQYNLIDEIIEDVRKMRKQGYLLYDSDQYLDDIKRFVREEPITWRNKRGGVCDSPNLYFVVLPNGEFSPCCDHRIRTSVFTYSDDFVEQFKNKYFRNEVHKVTSSCMGCMFGSFPEITISMRFRAAQIQRARLFFTSQPKKKWPISYEQILENINNIRKGISQNG